MLQTWPSRTLGVAVPEPVSITVAGTGLLALVRRRG